MSAMKSILVTGAGGQLARTFKQLSGQYPDYRWRFANKIELDLSDEDQIAKKIADWAPEVVINCAAYTAVDDAEQNPELAYAVNSAGVKALAEACEEQSALFVHYSTDYVYHNDLNRPLTEEDPCQPKGVYACSKWAGEQQALRFCSRTAVLRTSWVFSPYGKNFVKTMLRLSQKMERLTVVDDQIGAPTATDVIVQATMKLIERFFENGKKEVHEIYNLSNSGVASWYDFACAVMELAGKDVKVVPIPGKDFPQAAPRPHYSLMSMEKIKGILKEEPPHWRKSLEKCLTELGEISKTQTN